MSGTIRLLHLYAYMAWAEKTLLLLLLLTITLLSIYVLGNLHLFQIVSGIGFSHRKEIHPIIIIIIIIIIAIIILSLVTSLSSLSLLLSNQRRSAPPRLHVPDCSTFRIMCYVSSIVVFCS